MVYFVRLIYDTSLSYLLGFKMSIIIFSSKYQISICYKETIVLYYKYRKKERRNMTKLILKKDWEKLTIMEWEGILEDVSEVSTKFKYRTFTIKEERVYELVMKNEGKICGRWNGNKITFLRGCSACHEEIIDAYLTGYCAGLISNRLSLIQKVSDCEMWIGMEVNK